MIYNSNGSRNYNKLRLLEKEIGHSIGKRIYSQFGSWLFISGNKIIKIVQVSEWNSYERIETVLKWAINNKNPSVVKIYDYGHVYFEEEYYYYYVMEKLERLSPEYDDELATIVRELLASDNRGMLKLLSPKMSKFIGHAIDLPYYHGDIHSGNIMANKLGQYKFVDLEGFRGRGRK